MDEFVSDVLSTAKASMEKAIESLEKQLTKIRAGKASPIMLAGVKVDYYGSLTPLDQVASVTAPDPQTLSVKPWEKSMIPVIEKAIHEANLGLNPGSDAEMVRIPIPRLTEERRRDLAKKAKEEGEQAKIAIRHARKSSNDDLKALQKDGISEDEVKNGESKVQDLTNEFSQKVDAILSAKEKEIMTV